MKKINRKQAGVICFKVDIEGLTYALQEGYLSDLEGTKYNDVFFKAQEAITELEKAIKEIRDEFDIGES